MKRKNYFLSFFDSIVNNGLLKHLFDFTRRKISMLLENRKINAYNNCINYQCIL